MTVVNEAMAFTKGVLGVRVIRATATLPQTAAAAIFTITGGKVLITSIIGEVTTVIQTQADATKLTFDPTDAGATQDLCATTDITADAVGTVYSITGTPATALQDALNFLPPNKALVREGVVLKPGSILLDCAASNTGSVKWDLRYIPLDDGAAVVAA
jgi:hypothetical protein